MDTKTNRKFSSFLDDLRPVTDTVEEDVEAELEQIAAAPTIAFDYLSVADELHSGRIQVQPDRRKGGRDAAEPFRVELAAYLEAAATRLESAPVEAAADPADEKSLLSIEPKDIAAELGLETAPVADYPRIRRSFAFANHPDRVAPHLRERAMLRMQVANMLIDDARLRAGTSVKR